MTKTLTQLVSAVQAQLIDDGTRFSTATITAAVRSTLAKMNKRIPLHMEEVLDTVAGQYTYEATSGVYVTDVLQYLTTTEVYPPLEYQSFTEDNRAFFRLHTALASGLYILCRYAQLHTISGLDSATDSTLTADQDQVLIDGACADSISIRAAYIVENNNLNKSAAMDYQKLAIPFTNAYESGVKFYERRAPAPSVDRVTAWNDQYHGWTV
jgi:hypothetical protein